jgi:hypothetical protein
VPEVRERTSRVEVDLRSIGDRSEIGTELTFTQACLWDDASQQSHSHGWSGALDKLARHVEPASSESDYRPPGHPMSWCSREPLRVTSEVTEWLQRLVTRVGDPMKSGTEIQCSACGARYGAELWVQLALSNRVDAQEVRRFVLGWPEDNYVEVRRCRCGQPIATRRIAGGTA